MSLVLSHNDIVQIGLRIASSAHLNAFCDHATSKPDIGRRLEDLRIVIYDHIPPSLSLRRCLTLVPNLVDLDLLLSAPFPPNLLDGVILEDLRFFCTNLLHDALVAFFAVHSRLSVLMLESCHAHGLPECPLHVTDLPHLKCISRPASCVSHFAKPGLTRLGMTLPNDTCSILLLLRAIPFRLFSVCTLTIDFRAGDPNILSSVIASCPTVRKLKLLEKPSAACCHVATCCAWNDTATWSKSMRSLTQLEEIMLRTASPIVQRSGNEDNERKVLMRWITGLCSVTRGQPHHHPTLYHIGV
ncbi:hypothetical protein L226DRAFT_520583 [Lentinus tigrinus ALCF2SS1-7]|uniref:uncharacterized protein n=1 Tax=Lentinus tigrinus ALCF2SS1-7 TaxID=1328758 RepID=UPI0011660E40|nr:hypothetical protein L226DRAFT_520583 [Lentinus tigrinus ALCF2SS1-7]